MAIHVVSVQLMNVNTVTGEVYQRGTPSASLPIKNALSFDTQHRIIATPDVPNSTGNPDIKTYLVAEDAAGYNLVHMDQYVIVTRT